MPRYAPMLLAGLTAVWASPSMPPPSRPRSPEPTEPGPPRPAGAAGDVYHVTELDRNYNDRRFGTLRYGLDDNNFKDATGRVTPRTIVFDVGGTFWMGRFGAEKGHDNGWDSQSRYNLGQPRHPRRARTAPGGVYLMGGVVKANGQNTIVPQRHHRTRLRPPRVRQARGRASRRPPAPSPTATPTTPWTSAASAWSSTTSPPCTPPTRRSRPARPPTISPSSTATSHRARTTPRPTPRPAASATPATRSGRCSRWGSNANLSVHHNLYAHQKGRLPRVGTEVDDLADPTVGAYKRIP